MKWYFIILIIVGYLVIGSALAGLTYRIDKLYRYTGGDDEIDIYIVTMWPIIIPIDFVVVLCLFVYELFKG